MKFDLREIELKRKDLYPASKGYFHSWCSEPFYSEASGYLNKTYALVELIDGSVHLIEPFDIKFTIRPTERIATSN